MRINNNVMALNAHRQLGMNQAGASKSMEKLSSGFRINRAGDDAAGLAISEKMRGQIRGLKQATRNAQDGISLIQTAEGALNETHAILQRMRELAVQASTDTNTPEDRKEIQKEINQLLEEIDRISNDTEFNTQKLLDGSFEGTFHIGANENQNVTLDVKSMSTKDIGGEFGASKYNEIVGTTKLEVDNLDFSGDGKAATIKIGDEKFTLAKKYANVGELISDLNEAFENVEFAVVANDDGDEFLAIYGADDFVIEVDDAITDATGITNNTVSDTVDIVHTRDVTTTDTDYSGDGDSIKLSIGKTVVTLDKDYTNLAGVAAELTEALKAEGVEVAVNEDDDGLVFSSDTEFEISVGGPGGATAGAFAGESVSNVPDELDLESTVTGLHNLKVNNPETAKSGGVLTRAEANKSITAINDALEQVSAERSKLGAMQNRLEHTIANLGTSAENLQAAESRIRDLDMAEEIMAFTKNNILQQAATAMLAQANMAPQSVLQLLG